MQIISELKNYPVSALNKQALPKSCQKVHGF